MLEMPRFSDTSVRVCIRPAAPQPYLVAVARAPMEPRPEVILGCGRVGALLSHESGSSWPDRAGLALLAAMLEAGDGALLAFETLNDALACEQRLRRAGAR